MGALCRAIPAGTLHRGGLPQGGRERETQGEEGAAGSVGKSPRLRPAPPSWFPARGRPLLSTVLVPFPCSRAPEDQTDQLGSRGPGG